MVLRLAPLKPVPLGLKGLSGVHIWVCLANAVSLKLLPQISAQQACEWHC